MHPLSARAILEWYRDAGVWAAVEPVPQPMFRAASPPPAPLPASAPRAAAVSPALAAAPAAAIARARELADAATSLEELRAAVEAFDGCSLKKSARHTVFADGTPEARVMLVGEAPGAEEDRQGIPFCGPAGQLLNRMFEAISLPRAQLYITNSVFWRPPGNRTPSPEEVAVCRPFVQKHIALLRPKVVIVAGNVALRSVLEKEGITRLRGAFYPHANPYQHPNHHSSARLNPHSGLRRRLAALE
jgi:DNA polymerase